ncbi:hypothetical protein HD806DRAFT_473441 [Xylariaceae sp. AK1471]|nr:hypothetical protein HD806DRAFT_473441 [Xylariaceae sp. AK1471]
MGIASGIGHMFESIAELIQGFFAAILNVIQFAINGVVDVCQFVINGIVSLFSGFVNFVEGTLGFAFHNFFILGTLAAGVLGYMMYTQRQGTAPASRAVKS